ncbi:MAG: endo-beta-N-acetylglucosaminidase [Deltaproteobacteria bacterium]|nr:endo-beta-N-acetylglucosaminidase [Deltaproteobacteria bacterium]MBU52451.1 endo-beta-N-acetylglucosaminidase [Deltaproteobacteria bacterium]
MDTKLSWICRGYVGFLLITSIMCFSHCTTPQQSLEPTQERAKETPCTSSRCDGGEPSTERITEHPPEATKQTCLQPVTITANTQKQPAYSSYWFPSTLRTWTPENDPDAPFNKSVIPLAKRATNHPIKVNSNARTDPKVVALSIMYPSTSNAPSQGNHTFHSFTFQYWQYIDILVMWGGSAGEGLILSPSADVIDAGHKHGVKVLGTVFFPPVKFGGKYQWVRDLLQKNADGIFPIADKLLEVATYYGFDGWFINQETAGGNAQDATLMREFLLYLQAKKPAGMHIMWYDSMLANGSIQWQNKLTAANQMFFTENGKRVSDSMFLNFWWNEQRTSRQRAESLKRDPYDLYAGIDVQAKGYDTTAAWSGLFPTGAQAHVSLGLYAPNWTYTSSQNVDEFYRKAKRFWVGAQGDPKHTGTTHHWKGIAHDIVAKTAITTLPFVTHFNTGQGTFYAREGKKLTTQAWSHRSLQDILPTWRWRVEPKGALVPSLTWSHAYNGGSSLKLAGDIKANEDIDIWLYKTSLALSGNEQLQLVYSHGPTPQAGASHMKLLLFFQDAPTQAVQLDVNAFTKETWDTQMFALDAYKGKTLVAIGVRLTGEKSGYQAYIGRLAVLPSAQQDPPKPVTDIKVLAFNSEQGIEAEVRLQWKGDNATGTLYEVYTINANGDKVWRGATYNNHYYMSGIKREGGQTHLQVSIIARSMTGTASQESTLCFGPWPTLAQPKAGFRASFSFIRPGGGVIFTNTSSITSQSFTWTFPGGEPTTSTETSPTVIYKQAGVYDVTLKASNESGEDTRTIKGLVTVSEDAKNTLTNLAKGKPCTASGFVQGEDPAKAVDGTTSSNSKWAATGKEPHWLVVDLQQPATLYRFQLKFASEGGESKGFNTRSFQIQTSEDNTNWTTLVDEANNEKGLVAYAIPATKARYVRLQILKATQGGDTAARIYEFEVYGR